MTNKKYGSPTSSSRQGYISDPVIGAPSDVDLMQTMISRIALLERHAQMQAKQIQDKV